MQFEYKNQLTCKINAFIVGTAELQKNKLCFRTCAVCSLCGAGRFPTPQQPSTPIDALGARWCSVCLLCADYEKNAKKDANAERFKLKSYLEWEFTYAGGEYCTKKSVCSIINISTHMQCLIGSVRTSVLYSISIITVRVYVNCMNSLNDCISN